MVWVRNWAVLQQLLNRAGRAWPMVSNPIDIPRWRF